MSILTVEGAVSSWTPPAGWKIPNARGSCPWPSAESGADLRCWNHLLRSLPLQKPGDTRPGAPPSSLGKSPGPHIGPFTVVVGPLPDVVGTGDDLL